MNMNLSDAWLAVSARDARADGRFVFAVKTTGIYCRPSCPARRPRRENAEFFATPARAESAGFRACRRCDPRGEGAVAAEARLVREAKRLLAAEDAPRVSAVARALGVAPSKLSRAFARSAGVTPKAFATAARLDAFKRGAQRDGVTEAQYAAGFSAPSRLYASSRALGMTPGAWARGGRGQTIRYGYADSPAGRLLIASTARGVCAVELGGGKGELLARAKKRFPAAAFVPGGAPAYADLPRAALDLRGTAFQLAVWAALRRIPRGSTRTYAQVARELDRPKAVRAVARACASNPAALAVPCHRVVGSDGSLRGYRWGVARKKKLLALEAA